MHVLDMLFDRAARTLAADAPVSRGRLLLGSVGESSSAAAARAADADAERAVASAGGGPTTPQETAALRAILDGATPSRVELLGLNAALAQPAADGRLSSDARSRIARTRARLLRAKAQASSVRHRSSLRLGLISYLADSDALLATLEELGSAPDPGDIAGLRTRLTSLNTRLTATEKRLLPKLHPARERTS